MSTTENKSLINTEQAAQKLGVSTRTLASWRSTGYPSLPYMKVGRCVRYRLDQIEAFLAKNSFNSVEG